MASLYIAEDREDFLQQFAPIRMESFTTVAYALLAGDLDAGFVEAKKLEALSELEGFEELTAIGKVTYPYGATLITRKGLHLRINELAGLNIAVSSPKCELLATFQEDAKRLGVELADVSYTILDFDAMIPALEAGQVDAVIIKGFYSVVALQQGHSILYQNWNVEAGDECCPAIIDQVALVLLARRENEAAVAFADLLLEAQEREEDLLRQAVADKTTIPYEILTGQPIAEFSSADDEVIKIFVEHGGKSHGLNMIQQ
jgi:hypothetical protein